MLIEVGSFFKENKGLSTLELIKKILENKINPEIFIYSLIDREVSKIIVKGTWAGFTKETLDYFAKTGMNEILNEGMKVHNIPENERQSFDKGFATALKYFYDLKKN